MLNKSQHVKDGVKLCEFKKFYTFSSFTLDYTDIIWQFLHLMFG